MKHLSESLTKNLGIGRESYNKQFLKKIFGSNESDFFEKLCHHIGIKESNKLFDEVKKLVIKKLDKDADILKRINYGFTTAFIYIKNSEGNFILDLADMVRNEGIYVIELDCFKDVYKELDKMFSKYTNTYFERLGEKRIPYRMYNWKDCTIALDTI